MVAEFVGTFLLAMCVFGGSATVDRYVDSSGLALFIAAIVTGAGLAVLIHTLGPVSGGHFHPLVTLAEWALAARGEGRDDPNAVTVASYIVTQIAAAVAGALVVNGLFQLTVPDSAELPEAGMRLWLSEVITTAGLLLVIVSLARSRRAATVAWAVAAWVVVGYFLTPSTGLVNPAITIARGLSGTSAAVNAASLPGLVIAQVVGGVLGVALAVFLHPEPAEDLVVPHEHSAASDSEVR
jgi:arsenate reductase